MKLAALLLLALMSVKANAQKPEPIKIVGPVQVDCSKLLSHSGNPDYKP
jgi:hypothetical protein